MIPSGWRRPRLVGVLCLLALLSSATAQTRPATKADQETAVLWTDPGDIRSRDVAAGPLGKGNQPEGPFKFVSEDLKQGSPKFDVTDRDGKKWRAKVGPEAQPETVATRLLWAMGYFANENCLVPDLVVEDLPRLHRGREFVSPGGHVRNVRLQRRTESDGKKSKKEGKWEWKHNPFVGTREFNGLRVMMALISNWDLVTNNTAIRKEKDDREVYEVSDVGASFGKTGVGFRMLTAKNNLNAYRKARFISKVTPEYVDFNFPTRPAFFYMFTPGFYHDMTEPRWIGRHIPRADVKWIASLLSQLSDQQIHDLFRAANYSPAEVDSFASALEARIQQLKEL